MAHQRGQERTRKVFPITYRSQFLTWESIGRSTREEAEMGMVLTEV
jgi:hypothetical protein